MNTVNVNYRTVFAILWTGQTHHHHQATWEPIEDIIGMNCHHQTVDGHRYSPIGVIWEAEFAISSICPAITGSSPVLCHWKKGRKWEENKSLIRNNQKFEWSKEKRIKKSKKRERERETVWFGIWISNLLNDTRLNAGKGTKKKENTWNGRVWPISMSIWTICSAYWIDLSCLLCSVCLVFGV